MNNDFFKYLRLLNYMMITLLAGYLFLNTASNSTTIIILILIYAIQSQLRWFYWSKLPKLFMLSIILEFVLVFYLHSSLSGPLYMYLYLPILDSIAIPSKKVSFLSFSIAFGICILKSVSSFDFIVFSSNIMILCIILVLSLVLIEERSKKINAQNLYDKLRFSENELIKANKELEQYSSTIKELTLYRERTRISRELHDSVGHTLSTLIIQLQAIQSISLKKPEDAFNMLGVLVDFTKSSLENVRRSVHEMKPTEFESLQGVFAIEKLCQDFEKMTGIEVKIILSNERWSINSFQSQELYRIVQEFLTNTLKYSKATKVTLSIIFESTKLHMQIKDNGIGCLDFNPAFGLNGIANRMKTLHGDVNFFTSPNQGFEMILNLPINAE